MGLREGLWERDPMERVRAPRLDQGMHDPVSLSTFQALVATCDKSVVGLRGRAMLMVLLDSGLRVGKLVALNVGDVDLGDGAVLVRTSKTRRPRVTFVERACRRRLPAT